MKQALSIILLIPLVVGAVFLAGCEDDDSPSGTATVTGNVRQFYSPNEIAVASAEKVAAGVTVELRLTDGSYSAMSSSAADGTFTFTDVPAGDFELVLTGGGLTGTLTFTVPDGATVELVDIIVKTDGTTLEGAIVKSEPAPAPTPTPEEPAPAAPKVQWIDQQYTTSTSPWGINKDAERAQTFTVGATNGAIFKIEVDLSKQNNPVGDLTFAIRAVPGGVLANMGTDLGTAIIKGVDVGAGWETATFATPVAVTAGQQYALVVTTPVANPDIFLWGATKPGGYAGGLSCWNAGGGWVIATDDLVFKIWLEK